MHDNTPVLIGAGQLTYRGKPAGAPAPLQLIKIAAERALDDAGLGAEVWNSHTHGLVGFSVDAGGKRMAFRRLFNSPRAWRKRWGDSRNCHETVPFSKCWNPPNRLAGGGPSAPRTTMSATSFFRIDQA